MDHKFVELLQVNFVETHEEAMRKQITYRYNALKSKSELLSTRLADLSAMVRFSFFEKGSTFRAFRSKRRIPVC